MSKMPNRYTIGYDFGTLSVRGVLLDILTGDEIATKVFDYPHGVMDRTLPGVGELPPDWALQDPNDYLLGFEQVTHRLLSDAGVPPEDVIGIGIDFTACTILPVKRDGTPLCCLPEFAKEKHAYVKLWKHHAAQPYADRLNAVAAERQEPWLDRYGGKISCEWMVPKVMQLVAQAPEVYAAADRILEAGDWLVWRLTGCEGRSACAAGYKALYDDVQGHPSPSFFKALDARLETFVTDKLAAPVLSLGGKAGSLTASAAAWSGLAEGTAVAPFIIDAHASVPACGIYQPGTMLIIMGTSACQLMLSKEQRRVRGICGSVKDGVFPGYYGMEAGQTCMGDHYAWFVSHCMPAEYRAEAQARGITDYALLGEKAARKKPGESGLLALDWFNGVRSDLMDSDLSGVIAGLTLATQPEDIYRALIEATAFGTRLILDHFEEAGVAADQIVAAGGIAQKDAFAMQIYADICGRPMRIAGSAYSGALGSAIHAIGAAGVEKSGYASLAHAAERLGKLRQTPVTPNPANTAVYTELYREYIQLHDLFGLEKSSVLKTLKAIKMKQSQ